jgi:hypothetical protein
MKITLFNMLYSGKVENKLTLNAKMNKKKITLEGRKLKD